MKADQRGRWICVDGVETVGKTTVAHALAERLGGVTISEFSQTLFGDALRQAVQTSPHFISESALGQSLVFIGDFAELVKSRVTPALAAGRLVVTDRGYLSKYAYQQVVLQSEMSRDAAASLLDAIFTHILTPDLTLLLTAPPATLKQRLIDRGESCDDQRLAFMATAVDAAQARLARRPTLAATVIDSNRDVAETVSAAERVVAASLPVT